MYMSWTWIPVGGEQHRHAAQAAPLRGGLCEAETVQLGHLEELLHEEEAQGSNVGVLLLPLAEEVLQEVLLGDELAAAPAPDHRVEEDALLRLARLGLADDGEGIALHLPELQRDRVVVQVLAEIAVVDVGEGHLLVVEGTVPVLVHHDDVVEEAELLPQGRG